MKYSVGLCILVIFVGIGIGVIVWVSHTPQNVSKQNTNETVVVNLGGGVFTVDVVNTPETRAQGLSGRKKLAPRAGMMFVYSSSGQYSFWMKDMHFPIDIIWLNTDKKIVHIEEYVTPQSYPESFAPDQPARYVLEVNAGVVARQNVSVGDTVSWK